ncbi:MAG: hypothetical protein HKN42_19980 [Granulosicoccus sp.]|nr:hypothetical protein [Granulosicoccus sp.]
MSPSNSSIDRFGNYLHRARRRETWRHVLRFIALLCLAMCTITAVGTWAGLFRGFTPELTMSIRVILAVSTVLLCAILLWRPITSLRRDQGAALVEGADAAFNGRVRTYLDTRSRQQDQPFLSLLARDALSVARRVPLERIVPTATLVWPLLLLLFMVGVLFGFRELAPQTWQNAALHIWWGWKNGELVEPRTIAVRPGSIELLAGEDLDLDIQLNGFRQNTVTLHARSDDDEWQTTPITQSPDQHFRFTLFRVNQPLEYYVSAAYTQSETFAVSVIQPSRLERIVARFEYPEWTRLEPTIREDVGDISGVKNTRVTLEFVLDRPMQDGALRLDDRLIALQQIDALDAAATAHTEAGDPDLPDVPSQTNARQPEYRYQASFVIRNDTQYQLVDRMLEREVAISPEHAIIVRGDEAPDVKFVRPGRDVTASPIEEVHISIQAVDDFAVESIELLYSVNAGDWQSVMLPVEELAEHVFYLESMGSGDDLLADMPVIEDGPSPTPELQGIEPLALAGLPMHPGDLISYYVRVRDHDSVTETDMMLVDVRPFERRFSEGQGGAGGGGGGSGAANEGSEISRRQKEILMATWNLLRASEAAGGETMAQEDNARLLAELQRTLAEQARTLADRSEARELVEQGEEIRQFVDYLRAAAVQMEPSARSLDEMAFSEAIQPQQKALQLLQRAEALFADIRMTQQQGQGGGGQQAGKDMAEMFELEMDLERNQYEQPDRGGNNAGGEQLDDIFEQLAELARRQQALADAERQRRELTREEQWQQQQLRRELEQLQRDLEQLQQEASQAEGAEARALEQAASELSEQLQRAEEALEESTESAQQANLQNDSTSAEGGENSGPEEGDSGSDGNGTADAATADSRDASEQNDMSDPSSAQAASEALRDALRGLGEQRSRELQDGIDAALATAEKLLDEQRDVEEELRDAVDRAVRSRESGLFNSGMTREQMGELSRRKRDLQTELESVRQDVDALQQRFGEHAPDTGEALEQAIERLDESRVVEMLGIASDAISNGSIATALPGESLVTNAMREWRDRLSEARDAAADEQLQSQDNRDLQVADALDQLQNLRELLTGGQQGQQVD